jgi:mRNA-degrading endonuclease RelE of RelBE toxin-antitoxin system
MSYSIVVTSSYKKQAKKIAKKHKSIKRDIEELIFDLESNPLQGIPLGKDCYKIRMAISSKGKGKSGGARVITCVKIVNEIVYLLAIYNKSDKEDISDQELDDLLKIAGLL